MFYLVLFLFSPLVCIQLFLLRNSVIKLPEAEGIRKGVVENSRVGNHKAISIIYLGDSAAAGVGVNQISDSLVGRVNEQLAQYYKLSWHLSAKTGLRVKDLIYSISRMGNTTEQINLVVISIGVNEVTSGTTVQQWSKDIAKLLQLVKEKLHCRHVILTMIPPMDSFPALPFPMNRFAGWRANQLNLATKRLCEGLNFVSLIHPLQVTTPKYFSVDGFHPSALGYQKWANLIVDVILTKLNTCTLNSD